MSATNECPICYEDIGDVNCTTTQCGHSFHFACLITSLQRSHNCPYCRCNLYPTPTFAAPTRAAPNQQRMCVRIIKINDVSYLKDKDNLIYDMETRYCVGVYNSDSKTIEPY